MPISLRSDLTSLPFAASPERAGTAGLASLGSGCIYDPTWTEVARNSAVIRQLVRDQAVSFNIKRPEDPSRHRPR
jgi:hypothetical protein